MQSQSIFSHLLPLRTEETELKSKLTSQSQLVRPREKDCTDNTEVRNVAQAVTAVVKELAKGAAFKC